MAFKRLHPIKRMRVLSSMTQSTLGDLLGVHQSTVAAWESGRAMPRPNVWISITKFTGVRPEQLIQFMNEQRREASDDATSHQ